MAAELRHHLCLLRWLTTTLLLLATATVPVQACLPRALLAATATPTVPPKPQPNATEQYLSVHNQARAAVRVAALRWSPKLTGEATRLAAFQRSNKRCDFADLGTSSSPYGANQAWTNYPASPAEAAETWVAEGKYYDYKNNSCMAADHDCGTYTQVVWRRTAEVGCAQASCGQDTLTICLYDPQGNVQGEKPY